MSIKKELNSSNQKKPIKFITPFTTLDFPEHLACIVWFSGCNMRCSYCYNKDIVLSSGDITEEELLGFLKKRQGLLDGVVLSGGECTLYKDIVSLCEKIKLLGFKIKIDTNGTKPAIIKTLCKKKLVDFIALDFKAPRKKYTHITHINAYDLFEESLEFLIQSNFSFEARTTLHEDLLDLEDLKTMLNILHVKGYKHVFYIQHFLEAENIGNLKASSTLLDLSTLSSSFPIEFRNF